ncbi:MAG: zinc ribbon domain-containing protein [Lachnospiraceae bacterium]
MRDFFEDLGKKLSETAESVSKKTEEVVEIQKLKSQIRTMERNNDRDIFDLGKMVFERYNNGEIIDAESKALCEEIFNRDMAMDNYEDQIAQMRGLGMCPVCQSHIEKSMMYCPKCGSKLYEEDPKEEAPKEEAPKEEDPKETCDKGSEAENDIKEAVNDVKEAIREAKKAFTDEMHDIVTKAEDVVDVVDTVMNKKEDDE